MMCQEVFFQQAIWRHRGWGDKRMHNWNESPYRQWLECQAFHGMNHGMVFLVLRKIGHHSLQQDSTRTERCPRRCCKKYQGCKDKKYKGVITKEVQALPQHEMFFWNITSWGTLKLFPETGQRMGVWLGHTLFCTVVVLTKSGYTTSRLSFILFSLSRLLQLLNPSRQNTQLLDQHTHTQMFLKY